MLCDLDMRRYRSRKDSSNSDSVAMVSLVACSPTEVAVWQPLFCHVFSATVTFCIICFDAVMLVNEAGNAVRCKFSRPNASQNNRFSMLKSHTHLIFTFSRVDDGCDLARTVQNAKKQATLDFD